MKSSRNESGNWGVTCEHHSAASRVSGASGARRAASRAEPNLQAERSDGETRLTTPGSRRNVAYWGQPGDGGLGGSDRGPAQRLSPECCRRRCSALRTTALALRITSPRVSSKRLPSADSFKISRTDFMPSASIFGSGDDSRAALPALTYNARAFGAEMPVMTMPAWMVAQISCFGRIGWLMMFPFVSCCYRMSRFWDLVEGLVQRGRSKFVCSVELGAFCDMAPVEVYIVAVSFERMYFQRGLQECPEALEYIGVLSSGHGRVPSVVGRVVVTCPTPPKASEAAAVVTGPSSSWRDCWPGCPGERSCCVVPPTNPPGGPEQHVTERGGPF